MTTWIEGIYSTDVPKPEILLHTSSQFSVLNVDLWKVLKSNESCNTSSDTPKTQCKSRMFRRTYIFMVDLCGSFQHVFSSVHHFPFRSFSHDICSTLFYPRLFFHSFPHNHGSLEKWQDIWKVTDYYQIHPLLTDWWFQPIRTNISQNGWFPQIWVNIKHIQKGILLKWVYPPVN